MDGLGSGWVSELSPGQHMEMEMGYELPGVGANV